MSPSLNAALDHAHGAPIDNVLRFLSTTVAHSWELLTIESRMARIAQTKTVHVSSRFG
jgi:hypothetical protein